MNDQIRKRIGEKMKEHNEKEEALHREVADFVEALTAGVCPECGAGLKLDTRVITTKKIRGWFFKREVTGTYQTVSVVCPNGHKLVNPRDGANMDYPGQTIWGNCIVDEIRNYHHKNFSYDDDDDFGW